jgi:hypothetical protein
MSVPSQSSVIYYPGYSQQTIKVNLVVKTILSITQGFPAVLTTSEDHGYPAGLMVTFMIPGMFGMVQLNGQNIQVLAVTNNTLTLNVDSRNYTPFAYPSSLPEAYTNPSVIPNSSGSYLPPLPLQNGNQDSFEGVVYNNGAINNPINGN